MRRLIRKNGGWLRKVMSTGLIPLLLAQVLIALFCVPETLRAGTEIRREMTMEELRGFLSGEEQFTILLSKGGAVRGNGITILADGIHLGHIIRATDGKRHPKGSETAIAIGSVKEIRVEKMRGFDRKLGPVLFGGGALALGWHIVYRVKIGETAAGAGRLLFSTLIGMPVGAAALGYWIGKELDRETTIITIVD